MTITVRSILVFGSLAGSACADPAGSAKADPGRVAAVERTETKVDATQLCDVDAGESRTRAFVYPDVEPKGAAGRVRWINVWATWCRPCIEELPLITSWQSKLHDDGAVVVLELVAADESAAVQSYAKAHPEAQGSLQMRDPEALKPWLQSLGLDDSAGLPIHLFVDGRDRLRCARLGGIGDDDYDAVLAMLRYL
jgi:thiol-disulfide isomerase/thioredoxin